MRRASNRTYHVIYKTTCTVTNRWYIGMHSTDDLDDDYLGSGKRLLRSVKKHGRENHKREILEVFPSRMDASNREKELLSEEVRNDPFCLNCGPGGLGAVDRPTTSEETKKKIGIASKNTPRTAEWCERISASTKGRVISEEQRAKHSATMKGRKSKPEDVAKRIEGQLSSEKFAKRYRPVEIDGVKYKSGTDASKTLNIPGATLTYRLLSPRFTTYNYL